MLLLYYPNFFIQQFVTIHLAVIQYEPLLCSTPSYCSKDATNHEIFAPKAVHWILSEVLVL